MAYEKEFRKDMEIIRAAKQRCKIYSASYNSHYWYPFKLRNVGNGWDELDQSCMDLMVDSNISDDSITNEDIIEEAIDSRANKIIPKDYVGEAEKTRQSVIEFENIIAEKDREILPTVIPVLQDPHIDHLLEHEDFYSEYTHIAVGGLKDIEPEEQVQLLKAIRDVIGDGINLHGFGMGASLGMIKGLRENPNLLDSMDMSTAEQMVTNGKLTDWTFKQSRPDIPLPYGENKTTINAGFSKTILIMLNYMLTDMVNEDRLEEMFYDKMELHKIEKIIASCRGVDVETIDWEDIENSPQEISDSIGSGQQKINAFDK